MLRRVMADDFRLKILEDAPEILVAHVHVHEERALRNVLAAASAVLPQRIQYQHVMPFGQIGVDDMRADEAGPAGDENAHGERISLTCGWPPPSRKAKRCWPLWSWPGSTRAPILPACASVRCESRAPFWTPRRR